MRSKVHFKSHPLHPVLVTFPIAFFTASFVAALAGVLADRPSWWSMAPFLTLGGLGMAVLAAVTGAVDYFGVVPPKSSAKKRATRHMLVNVTVVVLFALSYLFWQNDDIGAAPTALVLLLQGAGFVLLYIGAWLGGTLVYRNQIGVDHRYADKGKWKDETVSKNGPVAKANELQPGQMKLLHVEGKRIVLGRTEEGYVAFDDRCTHRGGPLSDGALICGKVQCPWHGSQFDVKSGAAHAGPAKESIRTYAVREQNGEIFLSL